MSVLAISGARPPLVLVVDDNDAIRYSFCRTLRRAGIEAVEASTGRQALSTVEQRKPDLIVLDLKLPDMSGYEVARRIKTDPSTRHTLVLHASASFVDAESRLRALESADGYLAQPVSSDELLATVRAMLRIRGSNGEELGLPPEAGDVHHDLRAALEALREKNQVLEALVQASPLPIVAFDEERRVIAWNSAAEQMFGWAQREILGRSLPIITPQCEFTFDEWWRRLWQERRSFVGFETIAHNRLGTCIDVTISAALVTDVRGRASSLMMILEDIGSRRRSEELLRRNEKLIEAGRMAATLAHEINNPLSSLVNLMYLLGQSPAMDEHNRGYLRLAQEELGRVVHISKQILGMHRESSTLIRVSLAELMDNVLELYAPTIRMRHIGVHKRYRTAGEVMGYPGEFRQVFSNLVTNALEVLAAGEGQLGIHISPALQWDGTKVQPAVRVTVSDNGPGIPSEHRRKLFEPFFTTKGEKGTGLGLWVVKGIMEKHLGIVHVRTRTRPGKSGTCFTILFRAGMVPPA